MITLKQLAAKFKSRGAFETATKYAHGYALNNYAFKGLKEMRNQLGKSLEIRSKGFLRGSTVYERAQVSMPVENQVALIGTRQRGKPGAPTQSTGWIEQAKGGDDKRKRKWTDAARTGGNFGRQVRRKFRFDPSKEIWKWSEVNEDHEMKILRKIQRDLPPGTPWLVDKENRLLSEGVYTHTGGYEGKLVFLAHTTVRNQVKRVDYLSSTISNLEKMHPFERLFQMQMRRQLARHLKRI